MTISRYGRLTRRHVLFLLLWVLSVLVYHAPLKTLFTLSLQDPRRSHVLAVPFIAVGLVYVTRKKVFRDLQYRPGTGLPLFVLGVALYRFGTSSGRAALHPEFASLLGGSAIVLTWISAFWLCYGTRALRSAAFALSFLLLLIPLPDVVLQQAVLGLQRASAEVAYLLLRLAGVPVFREGLVFSMPGLNVEVAPQCSGVRSAFALAITGLLAGRIFLRTACGRVCLVLLTIPIAILKNAVRIALICWLASHVDEAFLYGDLHRRGGPLFSLLAIGLLIIPIIVFRSAELRASVPKVPELSRP
jgi:exosortase